MWLNLLLGGLGNRIGYLYKVIFRDDLHQNCPNGFIMSVNVSQKNPLKKTFFFLKNSDIV